MSQNGLNITNLINNNSNKLINNTINNEVISSESNINLLFLGIIIVLTILLVISILVLIFLFKRHKRIKSNSSNNMVLNKIVLKNPNNSISLNIVNSKDFQKLQNTSNVSDSGLINPNNVLSEIKTKNLKDEIHKIINTSSSSDSSRGKRGKGKRTKTNNIENKSNSNIIINNNKEEISFDSKNATIPKKENNPEVNTQQLEQEIKQQIKKYVVEEQHI